MNRNKDAEVLCVEDIFKDKYVIPLYQRNFAWGEEQISRLLQDIYESMCSGDERFYVGSLIVLQRTPGEFEVVDGQQRLTMLSILSAVLDMGIHLSLRYDSRPEVEAFFQELNSGAVPGSMQDCTVSHFMDAIDLVWSTRLDVESLELVTLKSEHVRGRMADYIKHRVCLVREIMPENTDVAAYFEIMNNRGEQLQEHEIVKGLLLGKLHQAGLGEYSQVCSMIWDACAQMETRIQRSFSPASRKVLFGDDYDTLKLAGASDDADYSEKNRPLLDVLKVESKDVESLTLEEIVDSCVHFAAQPEPDGEDTQAPKEESIIDFPNFLMHIFRLYYNQAYRAGFQDESEAKDIPLSEKYLLKVYAAVKQDLNPADFFLRLLYCRVVFDRYIVKSNLTNDDEKREWLLRRPELTKDENGQHRKLDFKPTFGKEAQGAIVRAVSCLQVSFRAKPYKNFLQSVLSWFVHGPLLVSADWYLGRLHGLMLSEFNRTSASYIGLTEYDGKRQGTSVPHYLFNFTDYLYWWLKGHRSVLDGSGIAPEQLEAIDLELEMILKTDFRFLNRNSIEHHYPQKRQAEHSTEHVSDFVLNCLGNLILISKSANSRLSDKNPIDKAALYSGRTELPPNRQIVYGITRNAAGWGKEQIEAHFACIESILAQRERILGEQ